MQQPPWPQQSYYSSHYAQAYMQQQGPPAGATTPQGYTLSSTYNNPAPQNLNAPSTSSAAWYQPGSSRCTYKTCTFRGSPQTVETHMMDRHLIYPPGWDQRKKKPDWDADPSLKGKPIPIQGTTVVLDSPEELAAWIAERKRRWPSGQRIEEKKRKMEEAVARGQLSLEDSGFGGRKRRRTDDGGEGGRAVQERGRGRGGGTGRARGRGRGVDTGRGRGVDAGWRGRGRGGSVAMASQPRPSAPDSESSSTDASDDDDGAPETVSSRPQPVVAPQPEAAPVLHPAEVKQRPRPPQPKQPVRNHFASRPTLLRNLLLPEIRITVSNLSQAIRFLIDNDFLQNVELRPGQANEKRIEVLHEDVAL
ncbi:nuclear fragile X mental retardation-interacting protein 1-domain-containing protein [Mycena epipterygia]|nr:nuclear fragile X mental retardation-interacting protein 1-domain-containing protein [Mycena epipterygia]